VKNIIFSGFRHGHIFALYDKAQNSPKLHIAGACEEDSATREALKSNSAISITDEQFDRMLESTPCDIVAIGDYYAKRGSIAIKALQADKHVIADKPLCTSLKELNTIAELVEKKKLKLGCMFDLRTIPNFVGARELIRSGMLGKITQIQFSGQHPLNRKVRPSWYFEPAKHGGTINDIGSHAVDIIPWLTGLEFKHTHAARTWQAFDSQCDCFNDAAQVMLEMNNGCGILGDVSYAAPDSIDFSMPTYWRFNIWGTGGMIEFNCSDKQIKFYQQGRSIVSLLAPPQAVGMDYLESFISEIEGETPDLNTQTVLNATRRTLEIQALADSQN